MSSREQRIAENEALFRDANERIVRTEGARRDPIEIICECGDRDCLERINVKRTDYERARSDPALFLAATGHVKPDAEQIVSETADHQLLRKTGDAAVVAEERNPRS